MLTTVQDLSLTQISKFASGTEEENEIQVSKKKQSMNTSWAKSWLGGERLAVNTVHRTAKRVGTSVAKHGSERRVPEKVSRTVL